MKTHYKVVIIGGGTGGITVAAQLLRKSSHFRQEILILDPAEMHYYQPLWTLVGAGVTSKKATGRKMESVIPDGAVWHQEAVIKLNPEVNKVATNEQTYSYDYLVLSPGVELNWGKIKGLEETLGRNGVVSNYSVDHVEYTWETLRNFKSGNAIFTHPLGPIKCGGAPQKIMYLSDEALTKAGVRDEANIIFTIGKPKLFDVPEYESAVSEVIERKNIETRMQTDLIEVRGAAREADFKNLETGEIYTESFEMLHVVPTIMAPSFIRNSELVNDEGWVHVHKHTLQHVRYDNVFSLGDSSSLPTAKTGAAIRKQAPALVENLIALMRERPLTGFYDGYTSCPIVTGYGRLILTEFDYDFKPAESMPFNQRKERLSMYILKKDILPIVYWNGMLKGVM